MGLTYRQHFETQAAQFFVYLISLITALSVNGMWQKHWTHDRAWYLNVIIAMGMVAVCIAIIAIVSLWTDKSEDREGGATESASGTVQ